MLFRSIPIQWSKDHDSYLGNLLEIYGDTDWAIISKGMNQKFSEIKRTEKDCRDRWRLFLKTGNSNQLWSDKERFLLLVSHRKYKNRWSEIAQVLHKQSRNLIKNRFYTLFRKIRNKVKNDDVYINSLLDLLEINYVLSLIEEYQSIPSENATPEKNYAHKLVQRMDKKKVDDYKVKINKLYKSKGTMEEQFEKCYELYGDGKIEPEKLVIKDEDMECKPLNLNKSDEEIKVRITLPYPKDFDNSELMSCNEKNNFWKSAFLDSQPKSATFSIFSPGSSSAFSQVCSAGVMRDDEGFGFSQFANSVNITKPEKQFSNQLVPPPNPSFRFTSQYTSPQKPMQNPINSFQPTNMPQPHYWFNSGAN